MSRYAQYNTLAVTIADRVMTARLSRPANLNAFTVEMANELVDLFTRVNDDDAVGAIVVTGEGRAFCAGMDLSREGNVFGLDESLEPTLDDLRTRYEDPVIVDGMARIFFPGAPVVVGAPAAAGAASAGAPAASAAASAASR